MSEFGQQNLERIINSLRDIILFWSTLERLNQDPTESSSLSVHTLAHHGVSLPLRGNLVHLSGINTLDHFISTTTELIPRARLSI